MWRRRAEEPQRRCAATGQVAPEASDAIEKQPAGIRSDVLTLMRRDERCKPDRIFQNMRTRGVFALATAFLLRTESGANARVQSSVASITTASAGLSVRTALKLACLSNPSAVQLSNAISATRSGRA